MTERKKPPTEPPSKDAPLVSRTVTPNERGPRRLPLGTPPGLSPRGSIIAVGAWLAERGIFPPQDKQWRIEITLDATIHSDARVFASTIDTRFRVTIQPAEWSFYFCHGGRKSHIHVTDLPRAEGPDEHNLASSTPTLKGVGSLVRQLEQRFGVLLLRTRATIVTTLPGTEPMIRAWVMSP